MVDYRPPMRPATWVMIGKGDEGKKVTVVKMHNKICKIMVKNEFNINYRKIRKLNFALP